MAPAKEIKQASSKLNLRRRYYVRDNDVGHKDTLQNKRNKRQKNINSLDVAQYKYYIIILDKDIIIIK